MEGTKELTNSARLAFQKCPRNYKIRYVDAIRRKETSEALSFGTAMHALMEIYWGTLNAANHDEPVDTHKKVEDTLYGVDDDFKRATLRALFNGYVKRYGESDRESYECIAAEMRFDAPLMNPETGKLSQTWHLAGKIDALAGNKKTGEITIVEHKTTSMDIDPGSDYWLKLPIDGQISGYYVGASSLGYEATNCVYDVIRKPTMKPFKATPEDTRKYKKDGTLYAGQHENDETPDEWYERLSADIASRPDFYYRRQDVSRPENDLIDYMEDIWIVGKQIMDSERLNRWPRNPSSCFIYGHCDYFDVCSGTDSLDSVNFEKVEDVNAELNN